MKKKRIKNAVHLAYQITGLRSYRVRIWDSEKGTWALDRLGNFVTSEPPATLLLKNIAENRYKKNSQKKNFLLRLAESL